MITEIQVPFFDSEEMLVVDYKENTDPRAAGCHILKLPFPIEESLG